MFSKWLYFVPASVLLLKSKLNYAKNMPTLQGNIKLGLILKLEIW